MEHDEMKEALFRAVLLLDCAVPLFSKEAERERRRNADNGGLRVVTAQERSRHVEEFIHEIGPKIGFYPEVY